MRTADRGLDSRSGRRHLSSLEARRPQIRTPRPSPTPASIGFF